MSDNFSLPGAENFANYLNEVVEGTLSLGPQKDAKPGKKWDILLNGKRIGEYKLVTDQIREYSGIVPGYRKNEVLLAYWVKRIDDNKIPFP